MTKLRQTYTVPEAEAFLVQFEGMVCASPTNEKMKGTTLDGTWSMDD